MSKKIKALELASLRAAFGETKDYIIVEPTKVDAATDFEFRKTLRGKKIRVQMVKNSYAKKIFGELGMNAGNVWSSTTLLCYGGANMKELANTVEDAVKASKKDPKAPDKYKIKTAVSEGAPIAIEMAKKLPTREEAIANVMGIVIAPGANLLAALIGPGGTLGAIVKAVEEKAKAGDAPAA
jgi:large subunit ribosomal protein L10